MNQKLKSLRSKINFALGRNPKNDKRKDLQCFIPEPYSAVVLIQADFEMAWAWIWAKIFASNIRGVLEKAWQERRNIPRILNLCDQFQIPITWATVGHLMLESCQRKNGFIHQEIPRLKYFENEFWKYSEKDWFEHDPGTNLSSNPEWYASDLIKDILRRKVKHEIGCHTFSHIDCSDDVCTPDVLKTEIKACQQASIPLGIELKSFVHPAHTIGNLETLKESGFTSFRTDYDNILGYPENRGKSFWELKSSMEFAYRKEWSSAYHIYRYKKIIDRAINAHAVCVFWFHPSMPEIFVKEVMPNVFSYLNEKRKQIYISPTTSYVSWLNEKENKIN
jgi:hypothetical protein